MELPAKHSMVQDSRGVHFIRKPDRTLEAHYTKKRMAYRNGRVTWGSAAHDFTRDQSWILNGPPYEITSNLKKTGKIELKSPVPLKVIIRLGNPPSKSGRNWKPNTFVSGKKQQRFRSNLI